MAELMNPATTDNPTSISKPINPWKYKPWWCQPWSILLTGLIAIASSWLLWKTLWVTVLLSVPVLVWMGFFLLVWPQLIRASGFLESYSQPVVHPREELLSSQKSNPDEHSAI